MGKLLMTRSRFHDKLISPAAGGDVGETRSEEAELVNSQVPAERPADDSARAAPLYRDMVRLSGGTFQMGSDGHYPEEAPVHRVAVSPFWIDHTPVTNRQFRQFVEATGYVTVA